jgi:hypothetical protein
MGLFTSYSSSWAACHAHVRSKLLYPSRSLYSPGIDVDGIPSSVSTRTHSGDIGVHEVHSRPSSDSCIAGIEAGALPFVATTGAHSGGTSRPYSS